MSLPVCLKMSSISERLSRAEGLGLVSVHDSSICDSSIVCALVALTVNCGNSHITSILGCRGFFL